VLAQQQPGSEIDGQAVEGGLAAAAAEPAVAEAPQVADVSLNGAQITGLIAILSQIPAGLLTKDGAAALIAASFPSISAAQVTAILAGVVAGNPAGSVQPPQAAPAPAAPPVRTLPASRAMTISVDFDRTFAADPVLWGEFARQSVATGNTVVMVSRRPDTPENQDEIAATMGDYREAFTQVLLVGDRMKDEAAREAGLAVDVWVDDSPQYIRSVEHRAAPDAVDTADGEATNVQEAVKLAALTKVEANAYGYGKPKKKPTKRAAQPPRGRLPVTGRDCGTGSGGFKPGNKCAGEGGGGESDSGGGGGSGGGDSGGGGGSSGGEPAKAGDGPLVKAARDEHKKALDKFRKNIATAQDKAYEKLIEKTKLHLPLQAKLHDHLSLVDKMSGEHEALVEQMKADPRNEELALRVRESSRELMDERIAIEPLERAEKKSRKERESAAQKERNAIANALAKEAAAVDKEDGFTASDRKRSVEAVEETHSSNSQVTEWAREQGLMDERVALSNQPYAAEQRKTAQEFLRAAVNPMIHRDALEGPIEYKEGARASAAGSSVVYDDGSGSAIIGRVQLSPSDHYPTVIHEFGHQVEHGNIEAAKLCHDFLTSRVKDESPVSFSEKFSGAGYRDDERGSPDDFLKAVTATYRNSMSAEQAENTAHYAGKRYAGQGETKNGLTVYGATEVLSIGMELLARDAKAFAAADPEWFDLVTGISTGRILTKTRKRRRTNY